MQKFATYRRDPVTLKKRLIEERSLAFDYGSALGFLRTILRGVEERAIFFHDVTTEYLRSEDRVWALPSANGTFVFTREARKAYESLTEALVADCPGLDRGIAFRRIRHELFRMISKYVGTDPTSLQSKQLTELQNELKEWFDREADPARSFYLAPSHRGLRRRFPSGRFDSLSSMTFAKQTSTCPQVRSCGSMISTRCWSACSEIGAHGSLRWKSKVATGRAARRLVRSPSTSPL